MRDGSVDLLLVLGFDRDIYTEKMSQRGEHNEERRNGQKYAEPFISQEFKNGFRNALRDSSFFVGNSLKNQANKRGPLA